MINEDNKDVKPIAIIPSRINSSRLPRKPLADIHGIPMIIHVLLRVKMCPDVSDVYVATDSEEIETIVKKYNGKAILTSSKHNNGTERVCEAIEKIKGDIFVIVLGDEAMLNPKHITESINTYKNSDCNMSILATKFFKENSKGDFKLVLNHKNEVIYMTRSDIPSSAINIPKYRLKACHLLTLSRKFLEIYKQLPIRFNEKIESNEFLRIIENGYKIKCSIVDNAVISVDYPEDLEYIRENIVNDPIYNIYKNT